MSFDERRIVMRGLRDEDVDAIERILRFCFIKPVAERYFQEVAHRQIVDLTFRVAEHDGTVIGVMMYKTLKDGSLYLACLAVGEGFQGRGAGRHMVEWLKSCLPDLGATELTLHVHALESIPQNLYLSCGFEIIETIPNVYTDGSAAHHMRYHHP